MNGSMPMLFEMQGKLREALKKIVASDFYVSIGDKESMIVVDIARTRKPESGSDNNPSGWYRKLGERIAARSGGRFLVAIDEKGKLVYDGFIWDIDFQTCDISRCAADIKDFMNGVNAARGVDPDQAVDDARFKAAAEAANLPDNESKREDGGDNL